MFFGRKHVETDPSCSHKLAIFLKYRMPLKCLNLSFEAMSRT